MSPRVLTRFFALTVLIIPAIPLFSHPHMFIDSRLSFKLSGEGLEGFSVEWKFDEVFTAMISRDYDRDGNGVFSQREQREIEDGAFSNLQNYGYFIYLLTDAGAEQPQIVENFEAWLDEGVMYYRFFVPYPIKAENNPKTLRVAIYDKSFYCDIATQAQQPVRIQSPAALSVGYKVEKNRDLKITYSPMGGRQRSGRSYTGTAYPDQIRLTFRKNG
jgi:ABC-type uncharacterized transport system substrate-binding protein